MSQVGRGKIVTVSQMSNEWCNDMDNSKTHKEKLRRRRSPGEERKKRRRATRSHRVKTQSDDVMTKEELKVLRGK